MSDERDAAPVAPEASRSASAGLDGSAAGAAGPTSPLSDDEPVPKLPRGKGITLTRGALTRIGFTAIALVAVLVLQRPCSRAVGQFVTAFGDEHPQPAPAPVVPTQYEVLTPSMTDDELRAAIGRAEARARQAREAPATPTAPTAPSVAPAPAAPAARQP